MTTAVQQWKEGYLNRGKLWIDVAQNTGCTEAAGRHVRCVCAHFCILRGSVWLGTGFCIRLMLLVKENHGLANTKSVLCSNCSLISIALEQICVFKTSYSRTHCAFYLYFLLFGVLRSYSVCKQELCCEKSIFIFVFKMRNVDR